MSADGIELRLWGDGVRADRDPAEKLPLSRAAAGDEAAFAAVMQRMMPLIQSLIRQYSCPGVVERDDLAQESLVGLLAAVLHEGGHILIYCLLFHRFPVIEVNLTGFCMRTRGQAMTPGQKALLAAAGPAVNLLLAGVWALKLEQRATVRGSAFWAANVLTGAFNLLPIPPLDGAQLAELLLYRLRLKIRDCNSDRNQVQ